MAAYRKAVGAKVLKSIHVSGTNIVAAGRTAPFEAYVVFPDRFLVSTTSGATEIKEILNGDHGWRMTPQGRTDLTANNFNASKSRLEPIFFPVKFEKEAEPRKVTGTETIGDRSFYVVESHNATQVERLYFDVRSGLLYKERLEVGTWFGPKVEEKTFEDYRDVGGVKMAFLITNRYMEAQSVFKISKIQSNVKVDAAKFEPPPAK
jgi:hypothetical protein